MLYPVKRPGNSGLLSLHEVERDRISVVRLNELEAFGFKLLDLPNEKLAFVVGACFELVKHLPEHRTSLGSLFMAEAILPEGRFNLTFDPIDHYCGARAAVLLAAARTGEVFIALALFVSWALDHEFRAA